MYILVDLLRHRHFLIGFEIIYNFDDDVLEEYGNIISDKGQVTSPKDQELANTLRKSDLRCNSENLLAYKRNKANI